MTPVDEIKDRLDIVDLIGRYVQLKKAGRTYQALCPFHSEKTPSFTVFPHTGTWHCFGCGAGGDLIDFVMRREGWDFRGAVRELARQAGVDLHLTEADAAQQQQRRTREEIFAAALRFYQAQLALSETARAYALGRGWTAETIEAAGLGYYPGDRAALESALAAAGIDLGVPTARALLAMPGGMLVYPHQLRGRVTYLSARSIQGKRHWNLPEQIEDPAVAGAMLVAGGPRQPYYNHAWRARSPLAIVVEGQADAITLAQWDLPAIALTGTAIGRSDESIDSSGQSIDSLRTSALSATSALKLPSVCRDLANCDLVVLALDADKAGDAALDPIHNRDDRRSPTLPEALLSAGLTAVRLRVLHWPAKDANQWLQEGADAAAAQRIVGAAVTWLDYLIRLACGLDDPAERDSLIYQIFALLPALDVLDLARRRDAISDKLDLTKDVFDTMLRAARREAGQTENGKPQYEIIGGRMCHRSFDNAGNEKVSPLCNFQARITTDIVEDDGERQERRFSIEGKLASGAPLPRIEVEASDFSSMGWPLPLWGARAAVAAGSSTRDHLRVAIQSLSRQIEQRYEYSHLGWRRIDDHMSYLSGAGAVGREGVQVRLLPDLNAYRLPTWPQGTREAMQASLRFLETGHHNMTIPLWAAMYLAPLSSIISPSFTIWLFGTTGSLKSTATALAMCHYGRFSYNTPPASWTGTANALELKAFLCKDSPLWIDDFVSQSTAAGNNELKAKADQLLRDWGNRAGRSRMTSDLKLRRSFVPRGLVISTAEQLPPGQSILSRLLAIEATPEYMTRGQDSPLSNAQANDVALYPHAMAGYLLWLADCYDTLITELPERYRHYTEAARAEGAHLRMPANVACMFLGFESGLNYAVTCGALTHERHSELRNAAWSTLLALGEAQNAMIVEEKPVELYLSGLEQMIAQGVVYLCHKSVPDDANLFLPVRRTPGCEFLGWYDEHYWYLLPKAAFGAVWRFYRASGVIFPDTERGVREKLLEQTKLFPDPSERYTYRLRIGEALHRVLRVARPSEPPDALGGSS